MKKIIILVTLVILIFAADAFGQPKRKKIVRVLPEVNDEVLVTFRKKQAKNKIEVRKTTSRKSSHDKYANQEVSYRKKTNRKNLKSKIKNQRRVNK